MKKSIPLKEIVGFLPYGLTVIRKSWVKESESKKVTLNGKILDLFVFGKYKEFKPIVRPISDLTKEITHNGETFVPIQELRKISGAIEPSEDLKNTFSVKMDEERIIGFTALCMHIDQLLLFQKLYEWHFDIYDWIKDGLAVDINTL